MTAPALSRNPLAGLPAFRAGTSALVVAAPAKLNLFLEVVAKRPDGYHDLESLMVGIDLFDTLELRATANGEVELVCEPTGLSTGPDNLVHKAATALKAHTGRSDLGAHVRLTKRVPVQAGLGGGSSDAAAALAGLNEIWKLGLTRETLHAMAASVGSDVAFFHSLPAAWCKGRGEVTTPEPAPATGFEFVVVCPAVGLATAGVFKRLTVPNAPVSGDAVRKAFSAGDPEALGRALFNRLEAPAEEVAPAVGRIRQRLAALGPCGARMSGSGSSVFAVCRDRAHASEIASAFVESRPSDEPESKVYLFRSLSPSYAVGGVR
jgi:4-diphosphocytidyl-2-C-methyl-D-erythritol kinase